MVEEGTQKEDTKDRWGSLVRLSKAMCQGMGTLDLDSLLDSVEGCPSLVVGKDSMFGCRMEG